MVDESLKISSRIKEELNEMSWTNVELAEAMGVELQVVDDLLADKKRIDREIAEMLGEVLEPGSSYWLYAQRKLDDAILEEEIKNETEELMKKVRNKRRVYRETGGRYGRTWIE